MLSRAWDSPSLRGASKLPQLYLTLCPHPRKILPCPNCVCLTTFHLGGLASLEELGTGAVALAEGPCFHQRVPLATMGCVCPKLCRRKDGPFPWFLPRKLFLEKKVMGSHLPGEPLGEVGP